MNMIDLLSVFPSVSQSIIPVNVQCYNDNLNDELIICFVYGQDINNHNHIKVIQPFGENDDHLYICGSGGANPRNWIIYVSDLYEFIENKTQQEFFYFYSKKCI